MIEVTELRCVKNRETVNMDYLKNIVLQVSIRGLIPDQSSLNSNIMYYDVREHVSG
jgi:hypothetical protein